MKDIPIALKLFGEWLFDFVTGVYIGGVLNNCLPWRLFLCISVLLLKS